MAQIDSSIYFQQQGIDPGAIGKGFEQGLQMVNLTQQAKTAKQKFDDEQALRDAAKNNTVTDDSGNTTFNRQGYISDLTKYNPNLAYQEQQRIQQTDTQSQMQKLALVRDKVDTANKIMSGVTDQNSYNAAIKKLDENGLSKPEEHPAQYDPNYVRQLQMQGLTIKDRIEQQWKAANFDQKERELNYRHEFNSIKRDELMGDRVDKAAKALQKDMDPDAARSGNFGQVSAKYLQGQRLKTLESAYANGNMPSAQMEEYALGLANMLSGASGSARSQVEALVPASARGDANKIASWIMNKPYGTEQQAFVQNMSHTVDREMSLAQDQLNGIRVNRLGAHARLKQLAPDQYNSILQSYGIDPSRIDAKGKYQAPTPPPTVKMVDPQGNVRAVPADQVEAAKAAGGKEL